MHVQAAERALADAGLTFDDVDGYATVGYHPMYCTGCASTSASTRPGWTRRRSAARRSRSTSSTRRRRSSPAPARWCSSPTAARSSRRWAVASAVGAVAPLSGPAGWDGVWGNTLVGAYALAATRHMHQYGTTSEQLAEIAVTMRRHAGFNPMAQYRDPITVDDVLGSKLVADPLHMLDCCVVSDGGGACIVTTEERRPRPPEGAGAHPRRRAHAHPRAQRVAVRRPHRRVARRVPVRSRWSAPASTPDDIDMLQLYDSFTITVLITLEGLGFCKPGEGGRVRRGRPARVRRPAAHQHRRRRPLRVPPRHARDVPHRRGGPAAARRRRARRRSPDAKLAIAHGTGGMLSTGATLVLGTEAP